MANKPDNIINQEILSPTVYMFEDCVVQGNTHNPHGRFMGLNPAPTPLGIPVLFRTLL